MRYFKLILLLPMLALMLFAPTRHQAKPMRAAVLIPPVEYIAPTTTTSTSTSTTSTTLDLSRTTTTTRANRGSPRQRPPVAVTAAPIRQQVAHTAAFWRRLANCESSTGTGGNGGGYFQMVGHGYHSGLSYDEQLVLAQAWAAKIHPREGTTAGWPHCWWVALAGGD
jgi:hypothetical protein